MSKAKDAAKAFQENCSKIDAKKNPADWNLNRGLRNLALAIADIEDHVAEIEDGLQRLKNRLPQ